MVAEHPDPGNPVTSTRPPYDPPTLRYLGTLSELTRGGTTGPDDGTGGAGDSGSLGP